MYMYNVYEHASECTQNVWEDQVILQRYIALVVSLHM
jgi:hypothetical protein